MATSATSTWCWAKIIGFCDCRGTPGGCPLCQPDYIVIAQCNYAFNRFFDELEEYSIEGNIQPLPPILPTEWFSRAYSDDYIRDDIIVIDENMNTTYIKWSENYSDYSVKLRSLRSLCGSVVPDGISKCNV